MRFDRGSLISPVTNLGHAARTQGLPHLHLFMANDLVVESSFMARASFTVTRFLNPLFNWRSNSGIQRYLIGVINSVLINSTMSKRFKFSANKRIIRKIRKTTPFRQNFKKSRRRRFAPRTLMFAERRLYVNSIKETTSNYLSNLIVQMASVFSLYTPVKPHPYQLMPTKAPVFSGHRSGSPSKGLHLLQTNPLFAKNMFNYGFLFKYLMTRRNVESAGFSKQAQLSTDYLFKTDLLIDGHATNLNPAPSFDYTIQRRLVKSFAVSKWIPKVTP